VIGKSLGRGIGDGGPGGKSPGKQACLIFQQQIEVRKRPVVAQDNETRHFCPFLWQLAKKLVTGAPFATERYTLPSEEAVLDVIGLPAD
jgi:hypothetical protein